MQKEDTQALLKKFMSKEPKTATEQKIASRISAGEQQIKKVTDELVEVRKRAAELEYGATSLGNQVKGLIDLALEMQLEEDQAAAEAATAAQEKVSKDNVIVPKDVT